MHREERLPYSAADGWEMVSLPGRQGTTLDTALPDRDGTPFSAAVTALYTAALPATVRLALPRFTVDADRSLRARWRRRAPPTSSPGTSPGSPPAPPPCGRSCTGRCCA